MENAKTYRLTLQNEKIRQVYLNGVFGDFMNSTESMDKEDMIDTAKSEMATIVKNDEYIGQVTIDVMESVYNEETEEYEEDVIFSISKNN